MPKHFDSPEEAVLHLSDEVTRLSGEVLAANVLAPLSRCAFCGWTLAPPVKHANSSPT